MNKRLFLPEPSEWKVFCRAIASKKAPEMDAEMITRIVYSVAVSFFCYIEPFGHFFSEADILPT